MQAEVRPTVDGGCRVQLLLAKGEGPFAAEGYWTKVQDGKYFLTAVSITRGQPR
jgi:hypothetical protein